METIKDFIIRFTIMFVLIDTILFLGLMQVPLKYSTGFDYWFLIAFSIVVTIASATVCVVLFNIKDRKNR